MAAEAGGSLAASEAADAGAVLARAHGAVPRRGEGLRGRCTGVRSLGPAMGEDECSVDAGGGVDGGRGVDGSGGVDGGGGVQGGAEEGEAAPKPLWLRGVLEGETGQGVEAARCEMCLMAEASAASRTSSAASRTSASHAAPPRAAAESDGERGMA